MPTIQAEVDFDLEDYEDEIKQEYCNGNCLMEEKIKNELYYYVKQMEQNLYGYIDNKGLIKTYEEVYNDLKDLLMMEE